MTAKTHAAGDRMSGNNSDRATVTLDCSQIVAKYRILEAVSVGGSRLTEERRQVVIRARTLFVHLCICSH